MVWLKVDRIERFEWSDWLEQTIIHSAIIQPVICNQSLIDQTAQSNQSNGDVEFSRHCIHIVLSEYDSILPDVWPKINVGHCDLYFMVQWLRLLPWRLFHVGTSLLRILNQYDPTHDLKINVGHRDLYFKVQRFYVISWRQFDLSDINKNLNPVSRKTAKPIKWLVPS